MKRAAMDKLEEERLERRCDKLLKKVRRLKGKRSAKPAEIQGERMASQDQPGSGKKKKKTKLVRLPRSANDVVLGFSTTPHPRMPSWMLAAESETTRELYRDSIAFSEKVEKVNEDMCEQLFRKGYIELEVTDDDDTEEE